MLNKLGYLGPKGTYSHIAAKSLGKGSELIAYPSFPLLTHALTGGEVDGIVLPVENTLNGAVVQNLDLLQATEGVWARASHSVKVEHRLITLKGTKLSAIKRIYSHEQALAQCAGYLFKNFRNAELITTPSTAESVKRLRGNDEAAIAGSQCVTDGLEISAESVSDEPNNYTQFLLVVKGDIPGEVKSERIFFSLTCPHKAGALFGLLSILASDRINMTKIESRPIKDKTGEFRFFIEIEGDYSNPLMQKTLNVLQENCTSLKIIGCY